MIRLSHFFGKDLNDKDDYLKIDMEQQIPPVKINPVIQENQIITVQVGDVHLPLRRPIPLSNFQDFIDKLQAISLYVDWEGESGWTDNEVFDFLDNEITSGAMHFFEVLADNDDWINREEVLAELKISGKKLAGTLSSPGQFFSKYQKEALYKKEWKQENEDEVYTLYYRLNPKYSEVIKTFFKS